MGGVTFAKLKELYSFTMTGLAEFTGFTGLAGLAGCAGGTCGAGGGSGMDCC